MPLKNTWHFRGINRSIWVLSWNHNWRKCPSLYWTWRVLFTLNSFHKVKQSTNLIIWKYRAACMKLWVQKPVLWPNDWILYHDNGLAHKALSVKQFLAQKSITEMKQPPYSPYLSPNDFWLFLKIKSASKGWKFQNLKHPKNCDDSSESYSTTGVPKMFATVTDSIVGLSAYLPKGSTSNLTLPVSCE
jgi:hypothetical protein